MMLFETETFLIRSFELTPEETNKYQKLVTNPALEREFGSSLQDLCLSKQTVTYQIAGFHEAYKTEVGSLVYVIEDKGSSEISGIIGFSEILVGEKQKKVVFITVEPSCAEAIISEEVVQAFISYLFKKYDEKNYLSMLSSECEHTVKIWKSIDISTWKKRKINGVIYNIGVITH